MLGELKRAPARMRINFVIVCLFLGGVVLFGGASRADVLSLPIVRLASIFMIALALIQIDREQWREIRVPVCFLLAIAAIIAVQLIPLPPQLWASLPGRAVYLDALKAAGIDGIWRPLSLTPDLTLNALLAMLPPLAAAFALGLIGRGLQPLLIPLLLVAIALNGFFGLLQIASNAPYFYTITNPDSAVGLFSNRNHYALLLATGFPALACWAALPHRNPGFRQTRTWLALCAAVAIFPILLTAGSRAGLLIGGLGALLALGIRAARTTREGPEMTVAGGRFRVPLAALLPLAVGVIAIIATIFLSRDVALHRLVEGTGEDQRGTLLPVYMTMVRDFFPFGAGFGSFDPVFRAYEPLQSVTAEYLNQAHNDAVQVLIEGGILPGILLGLFLIWFVIRTWQLWWHRIRSPAETLGRTGTVIAVLIMVSSLVDYPLRTPWFAVLMVLACCWMRPGRAVGTGQDKGLAAPAA
jgi:O-antigen ligase